jgi:uncharacterized membrane protein
VPEDDERDDREDNSLGRLLALSDGVFAIAMTLLALDLRLPGLGEHPTDAALRDALADLVPELLAFVLSFYVVANYWRTHRRLMRRVTAVSADLIWHTMVVLLFVAALPFPASILAEHGDLPAGLALYGAYNVLAELSLLALSRDIVRLGAPRDELDSFSLIANLVVFALCIPAGFLLGSHGPFVLLLLIVAGRLSAGRAPEAHRRGLRP